MYKSILYLLAVVGCFCILAEISSAQTSEASTQRGAPLKEFLNPDGTVKTNTGFSGSLDPKVNGNIHAVVPDSIRDDDLLPPRLRHHFIRNDTSRPSPHFKDRRLEKLPDYPMMDKHNGDGRPPVHLHERMRLRDEVNKKTSYKIANNLNPNPTTTLAGSVTEAWVKHYASGLITSSDYAYAIAIDTSDGSIYVTGVSDSTFTEADYLTRKYSANGNLIWTARYDGAGNSEDVAYAIAVDGSGNVYVTGYSTGSGTYYDYATIKYNTDGVEQWVARYDGPGNSDDCANALAVDGSGNVYVTGSSYNSGTSCDYATIKYNTDGVEQWVARYNGPQNSNDYAYAIVVDGSGNVYVTGHSDGSGYWYDYATIKYNTNGVKQWVARYDGPGNSDDAAYGIAVDGSGNVYVTGCSAGSVTFYDYATIKYNTNGVMQWVARYDGHNNYNAAYAIAVDGSGNVYVTGRSDSGTSCDYATIKYNTDGVKQWVAMYNGPGNFYDVAYAIAVDGSGNVYVTGISYNSGTSCDYATIKYNTDGVEQWVARYDGPGNSDDAAYGIAVDGSGNVYVTGSSDGSGTSNDYATIKYNTDGVEQWVARYNGPGNSSDEANAIAVDGAGNVYVTGYSTGSGTSDDYATIKYNTNGVMQWVARYDGHNNYDAAYAIAVDGSGNVYVTGVSYGSGTDYDYATIKYNTDGVEQWVARYNGPGNSRDEAYAIAVDGSGNVYVTGCSAGSVTFYDYATIKYNTNGVMQWVARYNGPGNFDDRATAIAVDGAGNVYVTGISYNSGTYYDYATIKYNTDGVEQWVALYDGQVGDYDAAYAIAVDGSGNVYVTGVSYGSGTDYDYATIKYNTDGVEQWVARYNGPNSYDEATAIAVDGAGNVYVTGESYGSGTSYDYATIKYNTDGVEQWVARYNGPGQDDASAIAVDGSGNVYVTGESYGVNGSWGVYTTIKYNELVFPTTFSIILPQNATKDTILSLVNGGSTSLDWNLIEVPFVQWLSANPTTGTILPKNQTNVALSINTTNVNYGTYQCTLKIVRNDPVDSVIYVPVVLRVISEGISPVILSVTPNRGGDIGTVTVKIVGQRFLPGATVKLTRAGQQKIVADTALTTVVDSNQIRAVLDLRNRKREAWNVVVTNPTGDSAVFYDGFIIEAGYEGMWVDIVGRRQLRAGREQTYLIRYRNYGNTDLEYVSLLVGVHPALRAELTIPGLADTLVYSSDSSRRPLLECYVRHIKAGESIEISCKLYARADSGHWSAPLTAWAMMNRFNEKMAYVYSINSAISSRVSPVGTVVMYVIDGYNGVGDRMRHSVAQVGNFAYEQMTSPDGSYSYMAQIPLADFEKKVAGWYNQLSSNGYVALNGTYYEQFEVRQGSISLSSNQENQFSEQLFIETLSGPTTRNCNQQMNDVAKRAGFEFYPSMYDATKDQRRADAFAQTIGIDPSTLPSGTWTSWFDDIRMPRRSLPQALSDVFDKQALSLPLEVTTSWDPNAKAGPNGVGTKHFLPEHQTSAYVIYFENQASATAAAQEVEIRDTLDTHLDWSTFSFSDLQIGDSLISIPGGQSLGKSFHLNDTVDVDVTGSFNPSNGIIRWYMKGRDRRNGELADFLPPNDSLVAPKGEGWVSLTINPDSNLASGTRITNRASIVFDVNPPMLTNEVFNTIDASPPLSRVSSTLDSVGASSFKVRWSGTDDTLGSGIRGYMLYSADDVGTFQPHSGLLTDTALTFSAAPGHMYQMFTIARDNVGNIEPFKSEGDVAVSFNRVLNRWNMLSLPLNIEDNRKTFVFPSAVSDAFAYEHGAGYRTKDTLLIGKGYWMKFDGEQRSVITGHVLSSDSIEVKKGWNMIGSISYPVPVNAVNTNPPAIISGKFFGYLNGYFMSDTIKPGKAYWVKVTQDGKLVLAVHSSSKQQAAKIANRIEDFSSLTFTDKNGQEQALYIADSLAGIESLQYYDMPPLSPGGGFDVRYASQRILEVIEKGKLHEYPISINAAAYPLKLKYAAKSEFITALLKVGEKEFPLKDNASITISDSTAQLVLKISGIREIPREFALMQNYPNPFNPVTTFKYQLPEDSKVRFIIYNILGQVVKTVMDQIESAGYKSVQWDASNFASGVYFYRLEATSTTDPSKTFTQVKKSLLLK